MMSLTCQGLASCAALAISAPIAFAAAHSELSSCGLSSRSCACEAAVARAESPHALSALRSSFFCSVPAPAPCCFAGGSRRRRRRRGSGAAGQRGRRRPRGWLGRLGRRLGLGLGLGLGCGWCRILVLVLVLTAVLTVFACGKHLLVPATVADDVGGALSSGDHMLHSIDRAWAGQV
eukprot:scaffold78462_cov65-Phaeocystis_antarctica.AAC.2